MPQFGLIVPLLLVVSSFLGRIDAIAPQREEAFIGWRGETYKPIEPGAVGSDNEGKKKWIEVISWKPRAFIYHNFLTDEEAEHIKKMAAPMVERWWRHSDGCTHVHLYTSSK
eukprot:GHUV01051329.1.p2 GENE.GHUV01051329.1~~GHUV01051329.1.p2  ORF type:complete len:112 (+),score=21.74 GHUV01051329.1:603-938(+)